MGQSRDASRRASCNRESQFRPKLINRFDEVVLFRPLNIEKMTQVAKLMLAGVNRTIANQYISVELTEDALQALVKAGYDPQFGARPLRRLIQKSVENALAVKILRKEVSSGQTVTLSLEDLHIG